MIGSLSCSSAELTGLQLRYDDDDDDADDDDGDDYGCDDGDDDDDYVKPKTCQSSWLTGWLVSCTQFLLPIDLTEITLG